MASQFTEMQVISDTLVNAYFEMTPEGVQIRHQILPDPAQLPRLDEAGQPELDKEGNPIMDDQPILEGELETLDAYKRRMNLVF